MAIRTYLQSLGATHLFDLDNNGTLATDDLGDSIDPTLIIGGSYTFELDPVCEGVTYSLQSTATTDFTTRTDGAILDNRNDINSGDGGTAVGGTFYNYNNNNRTVHLWFKAPVIDSPTCIYEQGAGVNNFAFYVGFARAITWQGADQNEPFLIAQSNFLAETNRPYFLVGIWEHESEHAGSGNRILLYINGVLQQIVEDVSIANFPGHTGDITIGNTNENLKTYNEDTFPSSTRQKNVNLLGMYNNVTFSEAQCREVFERTVLPTFIISSDTVENQQIALDAFSGTNFQGNNCSIRIEQATDATDYRLFVDNITFIEDSNLRDIAIQYVGTNILTLENVNGSNTNEVSTPTEVDLDGTTVLIGGGNITILNDNRIRLNSVQNLTNAIYDKVIIEQVGTYEFTNSFITELENVSGGIVNVTVDNPFTTVINSFGSTTNIVDSFLSFESLDTWELYPTEVDMNAATNLLDSGTTSDVYRFVWSGGTDTFYLRLNTSGVTFLVVQDVINNGETKVTLSTEALLFSLNQLVNDIEPLVNNARDRVLTRVDSVKPL